MTQADLRSKGHAIEVRLCAEDPRDDHRPQAGPVHAWRAPAGVRVDCGLNPTDEVSVFYDSMVAKIIAYGPDRLTAIRKLRLALDETELYGVANNRAFLAAVLDHEAFRAGDTTTQFLNQHPISAPNEPLTPPWWLAAALLRSAGTTQRRWRSNAARADVTVLVRGDGQRAHVHLDPVAEGRWRFAVEVDPEDALYELPELSQEVSLLASGDGWLRLEIAGYVATYRVRDVAGALWLQRPGHHAEALTEGTLLPAPEAEEVDEGAVVAPSAAMVTAVHVAAGDTVEEGQPLVTVEAMKMLTVLVAAAGLVEALNCAAGDSVASGRC